MPIVSIYYEDIERLVGVSRQKIIERLPMLGAGIERIERDYIDVEFFPDRPDLFSPEGVARAMRSFLGIEEGIRNYKMVESGIRMHVDRSVKKIRPFVVCCAVYGVSLDDYSIQSIMRLQENLHWTIGRNRRKVSVGIHDLDRVSPPFTYLAVDPSYSFIPLDYDEEMSMREILDKHPKGIEFRWILEGFDRYPVIIDRNGNTLSFPPIINAEITRVTERTKNVFVEVTGTDSNVSVVLNIVATALAERGGRIGRVLVIDGGRRIRTPNLDPKKMRIDVEEINELLGIDLSARECARCLKRMGHGAKVYGKVIEALVPAYRIDVMHRWDLVEDVAKGYGYDKLTPELPRTITVGEPHPLEERKNLIRELMIGLGFTEVMTFTLTNERRNFELMKLPVGGATRIENPISEEQTIVRTSILPSLLSVLSVNKHRDYPQRIFEVGDVVVESKTRCMLSAISIHSKASFEEIRSIADAILMELSIDAEISPSDHPSFLKGRRAEILVGGKSIGFFGEIDPEVLENFGLENPAVAIELCIDV